ncbi:MAG: NAD-dependent epimerase/dehydratase family protein [Isosphaeraceae bacterium]|nr:NAD-dependent epimerase/dehydratase family protein [Isosphaeraceae bacterium]
MTLDTIRDVDHLDDLLSEPTEGVVETLARLDGDLLILGVAGKMGPTLAWMARRAFDAAGQHSRRVLGVARFSDPARETWLRDRGIETVRCDLLDCDSLARLPDAPNVVSMFAMKFGATGQEAKTWAMNAFLPGLVAQKYRRSRIVAFSTGNVYALEPVARGGSKETDALQPVGEYGMSCLGRERILEHLSRAQGTSVALIRLNYAVEMRYGVLLDLGRKVLAGEPVDLAMGYCNVIWQADANAHALCAFGHAASPPFVLNVAGPEVLSVRHVAERFGARFSRPVALRGEESPDALLNDASFGRRLFGPPRLGAERLIDLTADWLLRSGPTLDRPTHFEARDGRF